MPRGGFQPSYEPDVGETRDDISNSYIQGSDLYNYPNTDAANGFWNWFTGKMGANRANAFEAYSQEDQQAHDFEFAEFSSGLQQMYHEHNMVNDPILAAQGLKSAGLSAAAVAQALAGNTPNGYSPTVSPGNSSHATGHGLDQPAAAQAMMQLPLMLAQTRLANSQAGFTETQNDWFPKLTKQQIEESAAHIRQKDKELGFTERESNSRVALNNICWNKTYEEIKQIGEDIKVKQAQINKWAHDNNLTDAKALEAFMHADLMHKQGKVEEAKVGLVEAQTEQAWSQTALNVESAEFQQMSNEMYEMKLGIATLLGMPLDSDEVSVAFMSMATGNFGMYNDVITTNLENAEGTAKRFANSTLNPVDSDTRTQSYYTPRRISSRRHRPQRSPYVNYHY